MMIELEPSLWNRTRRRNDKSARGHETAQGPPKFEPSCPDMIKKVSALAACTE